MTNLAGIVQDAQAARGEWLALRQGELALTYTELADASGQAAALLRGTRRAPPSRGRCACSRFQSSAARAKCAWTISW